MIKTNSLIYNIDNIPDPGQYYQINSKSNINEFDKLYPSSGQTFKVIVIGDAFVGKTTLIGCMQTNQYQKDYYATVGCAFTPIDCKLNNRDVKLHIWDTAGAEKHNTHFFKSYYRSSDFACVCFSYDNLESFNRVDFWIQTVRENADPNIPIFLVGCKSDLSHKITEELIQGLCQRQKVEYFKTSSLKKYGITNFVKRICVLGVLIQTEQSTAKKIVIFPKPVVIDQQQTEKKSDCDC